MPPVICFIFAAISFEAFSLACLIAVEITSSNISGSSGVITSGEILIDLMEYNGIKLEY